MKQTIKNLYYKLRATNIIANFFNLSGIQLANILLLILTIPLITRKIGLAEYGAIMVANRFALLAGSIINYGTGQSGIRDTAFNIKSPDRLSSVFVNTLSIRFLLFTLFLILLFFFKLTGLLSLYDIYYSYLLLALPIVLAEVVNPLCFFIGVERLKVFNLVNFLFNVLAVLSLVLFIKGPNNSAWVNFILGTGNFLTYLALSIYFWIKFKLPIKLSSKVDLLKIIKDNFYLTINNISVNLQQSIIIFALPKWGYSFLLGPYNLCDKIIGQCRNLLITLSNAIYPAAATVYQQSTSLWINYRIKTKYLVTAVFFSGSFILFTLADPIIYFLSKEHNTTAITFLRIMAFVPTVSALNVVNVLDQLLKNNTINIFKIAMVLFIVAFTTAFVLLNVGNYFLIASFTLIVETSAWLMYEYVIRKKDISNA